MEKMITVKPKMLRGEIAVPKRRGTNEGDFGLGAYFLAAGAVGNNIICNGLNINSLQKEAKILDIIKAAGGKIVETEKGISAQMTANMKGIDADLSGAEGLLHSTALLCAFLKGDSRITGIKAVDREAVKGIVSEFNHLGIYSEMSSAGLYIKGTQVIRSDGAFGWNNADLAMALMLAGCRAEGEVRVFGMGREEKKLNAFLKLYNKLTGVKFK